MCTLNIYFIINYLKTWHIVCSFLCNQGYFNPSEVAVGFDLYYLQHQAHNSHFAVLCGHFLLYGKVPALYLSTGNVRSKNNGNNRKLKSSLPGRTTIRGS